MMAQNLTKYTLVLVLMGGVLAIAVFRPPIPDIFGLQSEPEPDPAVLELQEEVRHLQNLVDQLRARIDEILERERALDAREAELDRRKAAIDKLVESLEKEQELLDERTEIVAEQERRARSLLRWSVVAMVVSGLAAVPSVMVLMALAQQDRAVADEEDRLREALKVLQRDRMARQDEWSVQPPVQGGNGRGKKVATYHS